jgi:hypothetical protein
MVVSRLEDICYRLNCAGLIVHHEGKDPKQGARGSSAIPAGMSTVLSVRKVGNGVRLRPEFLKWSGNAGDQMFQIKEVGPSIVLERVEALAEEPKAGPSRHDWAGKDSIVALLVSRNGELSHEQLVFELASKYGVDVSVVRRKLIGREDLAWLRPTQNQWALPKQEWDL